MPVKCLLVVSAVALLCTGCEVVSIIDALKPQSVKDAEERREFFDSCQETSRAFLDASLAKKYCECAYKKYKRDGLSAFNAGMRCAEQGLKSMGPNRSVS